MPRPAPHGDVGGFPLRPAPGEPPVRAWLSVRMHEIVDDLPGGRCVLAVDGRSGSGKSTLADRLRAAIPGSCIVHTDDIAWHAPMFGWADLALDGVLSPFRQGRQVTFRTPAWEEHERLGSIDVPAGVSTLILEGVGSSQRALGAYVDRSIWVQSDQLEARRLGVARDIASGQNGDEAASREFWDWWDSHEVAFLAEDRPWERADVIVAGVGAPVVAGLISVARGAAG